MTHKDVIVDFKKEGLINPPKMEGWPDGWTEYMEPLTHGRASNVTRRFFKDGSGFDFCLDEAMATNIFAKKGFTLNMFCQYITPEGKMPFASVEPSDLEFHKESGENILLYENVNDVPLDGELTALLEGTKKTKEEMGDVLFDMYGCWFVMTSVDDEDQAFKIADLMSKRLPKVQE